MDIWVWAFMALSQHSGLAIIGLVILCCIWGYLQATLKHQYSESEDEMLIRSNEQDVRKESQDSDAQIMIKKKSLIWGITLLDIRNSRTFITVVNRVQSTHPACSLIITCYEAK